MSTAEFWNERFNQDEIEGGVFAGGPNPIVEKLIEPLAPGRAIDLGCGRGRHVVWLAAQGWETTGLDFSEVGIQHTKQALDAKGLEATLIQSDLDGWTPEPESFELVLSSFMHFAPEVRAALWRKIAVSLAPGGHLVLIAHHPDNTGHGPKDPAVLYDADEVVSVFAAVGEDLGAQFDVKVAQRRVIEETANEKVVDAVVMIQRRPQD